MDDFITLPERGTWMRMRYYVRLGTPGGSDTHMKIWKNGVLVFDRDELPYNAERAGENWIGVWQIMGWDNSGWPAQITWYVDEVRLYDIDPGW